MGIKDRIQMLMEQSHMNIALFAEKIGITPPALHHILNGRNNASLDVIMKIHQAYDYKINLEWLLYGSGNMYSNLKDNPDTDSAPEKSRQNMSGSQNMVQKDLFSAAEISKYGTQTTIEPKKCTDEWAEKGKQQNEQAIQDKEDVIGKLKNKPTEIVREIQYVEKPTRQISEIRIFFDNGTYQVFHPSPL